MRDLIGRIGRACKPGAACALIGVAAPLAAAPQGGPSGLHTRIELPTAGFPDGLLAGDLDGDGLSELVSVQRTPGGLVVWRGLGAGMSALPVGEEPVERLPLGDFPVRPALLERPGRSPLLASASRSARELELFDLARPLEDPRPHLTLELPAAPRALAAGDLGLDGRHELLVLLADGRAWITGEGGYLGALDLAPGRPTCAALTSDGEALVIGYQVSRRIAIYDVRMDEVPHVEAFGSLEFEGPPRAMIEADVDGDGDAELCVVGAQDSLWILGAGAGGGRRAWLTAPVWEQEVGAVPIDLAPAGDELVVLSHHDLAVHRLRACGTPLEALQVLYAGQSPWAAELADLDGDGHPDLAVANRGAQRVGVSFGRPFGGFVLPEQVGAGRGTHSVCTGDLDGDGRPELVCLNALENTLSVLDRKSGRFRQAARFEVEAGSDRLVTLDLDADGHLDVCHAALDGRGALLVAHFGTGDGALERRPDVPPLVLGSGTGDVLATDLDGDGREELVASDPNDGRVHVLFADTSGEAFRWPRPLSLDLGSGPRGLAAVDVTGNGRREVICALGGPGPRQGLAVLTLREDPARPGARDLAELTVLATGDLPFDVAAADLDGDGARDLAVLSKDDPDAPFGYVTPWVRGANGQWENGERRPTGLRPYALAAGDLDGDGRAELLVTAQNSHHVNLWRSTAIDGEHALLRLPDQGCGTGPLGLRVADADGDGRLDVVVANAFSNEVSVLYNRGE